MASLRLQGLCPLGLQPVDLRVPAGGLAFLYGPSGCGKTLLLRAIADLDPHPGEAFLDGTARSALTGPGWRRRVGFLPAESHWWGEQVGEHFSGPDRDLLWSLGFDPEVLGWEVRRLSTGERQRLALARLLNNAPQALLLDEATANLDPPNRERVEGLVEHYRKSQRAAVLWVSHDAEQRRRLGEACYRIEEGVVVAEQTCS
jgi:ABC-type iron transport system FetAB ATPase subunit